MTMNTGAQSRHTNGAVTWLFRNHIWLFLSLAIAIFSLASPYFLTVNNISNVLTQGAFIGILAVGMTLVMIDGEIDLSVGAILALSTALAIGLQEQIGVWPAVLVGLLSGAALGFLNGVITAFSGMHSFNCHIGCVDWYPRPCLYLYWRRRPDGAGLQLHRIRRDLSRSGVCHRFDIFWSRPVFSMGTYQHATRT